MLHLISAVAIHRRRDEKLSFHFTKVPFRVIEVIKTSSVQFRGHINREKAGHSHNGNNTNNTAQFKEALLLLI
ncbi:hypothetical protein T4A_6399 [Trichinella pseudospiralis]|uniref:Uncharacterized protein n=1 Tax=Trichinella pseudospiralis TaxID=6337 RepID=A0A0V1EK67_TRIPS|nr:hypothetical protein T4A_6399 [Trichinella pseudospiralis]